MFFQITKNNSIKNLIKTPGQELGIWLSGTAMLNKHEAQDSFPSTKNKTKILGREITAFFVIEQ
jgi:hypothetical protein